MSQKTTVYLDEHDYRRLSELAKRRRVPTAALVREAIAEYTVLVLWDIVVSNVEVTCKSEGFACCATKMLPTSLERP